MLVFIIPIITFFKYILNIGNDMLFLHSEIGIRKKIKIAKRNGKS